MFAFQRGALHQADPGAIAFLWERQGAGSSHFREKAILSMVAWRRLGIEEDWLPSTCQPLGSALQAEPEVTGRPEDGPPWRAPCLRPGEGDK